VHGFRCYDKITRTRKSASAYTRSMPGCDSDCCCYGGIDRSFWRVDGSRVTWADREPDLEQRDAWVYHLVADYGI